MPKAARRRGASSSVGALEKRLRTVETIVRKLNGAHVNVRREEHDDVLRMIAQFERHTKDLHTQFARIAQIQAELDALKRMVAKMTGGA